MKILVTGHLGFIGSALLKDLKNKNHFVVGLDAKEKYFKDKLKNIYNTQWHTVYHLGAESGFEQCAKYPTKAWYFNVTLTQKYIARIKLQRFVFASSAAVEGMTSSAVLPSVYAATKFAGECACKFYGDKYQVARLSNVYGPGSKDKNSIVARMFKDSILENKIYLNSDRSLKRDFVYIDRVLEQLQKGSYNICSGTQTTLYDLASDVSKITGAKIFDMKTKKLIQIEDLHLEKETTYLFETLRKTYSYFKLLSPKELN